MQPILSFDAAPLHLQPDVLELLGELDIWWQMVPKKLTWLLQPLDTHSWSLEVCLHSYVTDYSQSNEIRLHMHACLQRDLTPFRRRTLSRELAVGGIEPSHIAGCSDPATGRRARGTSAMHYYIQMLGSGACGGTNYKAYDAFLVNPRWIAGYVQRNKLSTEDAKEERFFSFLILGSGAFDGGRPAFTDPDLPTSSV